MTRGIRLLRASGLGLIGSRTALLEQLAVCVEAAMDSLFREINELVSAAPSLEDDVCYERR